MVTHTRNADVHPGKIIAPTKRTRHEDKPKKMTAAEKQAAKAQKQADSMPRIAAIEKRKAEEEATNDTPRVTTARVVSGRRSHPPESARQPTEDVEDSEHEMMVDQPSDSANDYQVVPTSADEFAGETENSSSGEDAGPPKKKVKLSKQSFRDALKCFISDEEHREDQERHDKAHAKKGRHERDNDSVEEKEHAVSEPCKTHSDVAADALMSGDQGFDVDMTPKKSSKPKKPSSASTQGNTGEVLDKGKFKGKVPVPISDGNRKLVASDKVKG